MRLILRLLANMGALALATWLLSGITLTAPTTGRKVLTLLLVALIFGVVNAIVGPILRLLSLPFVLLTLGLFLLIINAALLGLTAALTDRLSVDGFGTAVLGGLILAVAGWVADQLLDR